jgi:hypothetical protein
MTQTKRTLPRRPARIQSIADGVVASYIHDISVRNRSPRRTASASTVSRPIKRRVPA